MLLDYIVYQVHTLQRSAGLNTWTDDNISHERLQVRTEYLSISYVDTSTLHVVFNSDQNDMTIS